MTAAIRNQFTPHEECMCETLFFILVLFKPSSFFPCTSKMESPATRKIVSKHISFTIPHHDHFQNQQFRVLPAVWLSSKTFHMIAIVCAVKGTADTPAPAQHHLQHNNAGARMHDTGTHPLHARTRTHTRTNKPHNANARAREPTRTYTKKKHAPATEQAYTQTANTHTHATHQNVDCAPRAAARRRRRTWSWSALTSRGCRSRPTACPPSTPAPPSTAGRPRRWR